MWSSCRAGAGQRASSALGVGCTSLLLRLLAADRLHRAQAVQACGQTRPAAFVPQGDALATGLCSSLWLRAKTNSLAVCFHLNIHTPVLRVVTTVSQPLPTVARPTTQIGTQHPPPPACITSTFRLGKCNSSTCKPPLETVNTALVSHHSGGVALEEGVVAAPDIHCIAPGLACGCEHLPALWVTAASTCTTLNGYSCVTPCQAAPPQLDTAEKR